MTDISIGVALIADDCLEQLQNLLPQLANFDQVVVGWNGTDVKVKNYLDKLSGKKRSPYEYFQFDWRPSAVKNVGYTTGDVEDGISYGYHPLNDWGFSYARNLTFQRLLTTHALWLDTDDLIGYVRDGKDVAVTASQAYNGFKKIAAEAPADIDVWFSTYVYSRDGYNNPNVVHSRERMIKHPQSWRWTYPIHEVLVPDHEPRHALIKDIQVIHYPPQKEETSADRNLRMLQEWKVQLEVTGGHDHDLGRCRLYIGDTYWAMNEWKQAADHLMEFIRKHPRSLDIEKWQAWCFIAKCQIELDNFDAARAAALAAIDIEPGLCDGYILLAQVKLLTEQDPQDILLLLDTAGRTEEPPPQVITNPLDYSYTVYCIASKAKYLLGQYQSAFDWAMKAIAVAPSDMRADQLRSDAAIKIRERDAIESAKALYQLYLDFDENEKADKLYEVLPIPAQRDDEVIAAAEVARKRVRHIYDREEYIKLYAENARWEPVPEAVLDSGKVPGESRMIYILDRLKRALPNGGRILDVGCSDGFHSLMYARHGYEVVGVDLDQRCVDIANQRARERGLPAIFVHGFFEEMSPEALLDPFDVQLATGPHDTSLPPASTWYHHFDAVICSEVIEHVQNPQFLMGSLVDCAKDDAPVIITTPDEAFDRGDTPVGGGMYEKERELTGHVRVFSQATFEALLNSDPDFDVVESHFVPYQMAYREHQGWQAGEIRRRARPNGPIIRVFCGDIVDFTPDDLRRKGVGGSETAVIHMARHWAQLGCQVVVYNGGENGVYDSVLYRNAKYYSADHRSDLFISWRLPIAFRDQRPNATTTIFWAHDLYYPMANPQGSTYPWPQDWVERIDRFVVLSNFHKDYFLKVHAGIPEDKILVSRNGIDPSRYATPVEKVPYRYFYSSSYDRGLEELLAMWPQIKDAIPDAELHVCYGIVTAEHIYKMTGETEKLNRLYKLLYLMKVTPGVIHHDHLNQQALAELQMSCEAWLYPPQPHHENGMGGFLETYCVTALEAQAARCWPITRLNGALPETVLSPVEWPDDIVDYLSHLPALRATETGVSMLDKNQEWAMSQTWESLATEWLKELSPKE